MFWICGPTADVVRKGNSLQCVKHVDTRELRLGRQWNPAASTLIVKLQRQSKNLHRVPFLDLLHGCQNTCASHLTASLRPSSSWAPLSRTYTAEPATHANTPYFIFLCFGRPINQYRSDAVGLTHTKSAAVPHLFTWLQKQHATHADSKNRWCAANADKTENKGRKSGTYTEQNEWHGLVEDSWTSVVKKKTCCLSGQ